MYTKKKNCCNVPIGSKKTEFEKSLMRRNVEVCWPWFRRPDMTVKQVMQHLLSKSFHDTHPSTYVTVALSLSLSHRANRLENFIFQSTVHLAIVMVRALKAVTVQLCQIACNFFKRPIVPLDALSISSKSIRACSICYDSNVLHLSFSLTKLLHCHSERTPCS